MKLGPYELLEELARGGMGSVHRARDATGRELAIKLLQPGVDDARFEQEAEAAARLRHPGIVTVHAFARDAGRPYLVMELVPGRTLAARLRDEGPLPPTLALDLALQLCDALAHAHAEGVLHRDLKPQNVILQPDGQVKLTDFGLARVEDQSRRLTQTGELLGTPAYMPPEQVEGLHDRVGPPADVYGLGATVYAMLCGRPPFEGPSAVNVLHAVLEDRPTPPSQRVPDVPPELERLVLRCLDKDPARRHASASSLGEDLRRARDPGATTSQPPRWGLWALALVATLLVAALAAAVTRATPRSPSDPTPPASAGPPSRHQRAAAIRALPPGSEQLRALHALLLESPAPIDDELRRLHERLRTQYPLSRRRLGSTKTLAVFDGRRVVSAFQRGRIQRWDPAQDEAPLELGPSTQPRLLSLALCVDAAWASGFGSLTRGPFLPDAPKVVPDLPQGIVGALAASPDGRRLAVEVRQAARTLVRELDAKLGTPLGEDWCVLRRIRLNQLCYAPDGERLVGAGLEEPEKQARLLVWQRSQLDTTPVSFHGHEFERLCISPDGEALLVGTKAGNILVFDSEGNLRTAYEAPVEDDGELATKIAAPRAHPGQLRGMVFSPDGSRLYSVSKAGLLGDHQLRVWETTPPTPIEIRTLDHEPSCVDVSPDGSLLLIGSDDGVVDVWLLEEPGP